MELTREQVEMQVELAIGPHSTRVRDAAKVAILAHDAALRQRCEAAERERDLSDYDIDRVREQRDEAQAQLAAAQADLKYMDQQLASEKADKQRAVEQQRERNREQWEQLQAAQARVGELEERLASTVRALELEEQEAAQAMQQLTTERTAREAAEAKVSALEDDNDKAWFVAKTNDTDNIKLRQRIASLQQSREALVGVILWMLGEHGDFPVRDENSGRYWWRTELRKRYEHALQQARAGEGTT